MTIIDGLKILILITIFVGFAILAGKWLYEIRIKGTVRKELLHQSIAFCFVGIAGVLSLLIVR